MALELRQQLKLSQQLVMTPQLQQAIKLLQLSRLDLIDVVQQELMENPYLEEKEEHLEETQVEPNRIDPDKDKVYDNDAAQSADWEDYLGELASTPKNSSSREFESIDENNSFESKYTVSPNLEAHLTWQLRLSKLSDKQKDIGEVIIGNLASTGYLEASVEEIAQMAQANDEETEQVLKEIQNFDPIGVAARNPKECLMIQIKRLKYDRDPILVGLITEHLEDLENKRYKPLLKKFNLEIDELKEYLDIIQSLDPMPGASFGSDDVNYVSPDVFVYPFEENFVIILNDDGLPQLQLSHLYSENGAFSNKEKEYMDEKMRSASWLIKSLHQRNRTLYKVMESILKHQETFFREGVNKLRPLILKEIADDIAMHESTVSRITTNKYVACPFGIFELKFFFNSALELDDGSQVGSESVKALIKKFIDEEDNQDPLSDEKIGELLKEHLGINIARRTVAKYRTALDIPSSSKRKSFFSN